MLTFQYFWYTSTVIYDQCYGSAQVVSHGFLDNAVDLRTEEAKLKQCSRLLPIVVH